MHFLKAYIAAHFFFLPQLRSQQRVHDDSMTDYPDLYALLESLGASAWGAQLPQQLAPFLAPAVNGQLHKWQLLLENLPAVQAANINLQQDCVRIGCATDLTATLQQQLQDTLRQFCPWRKGPYHLFGIDIDTEWRSDWKWQRLRPHISPLQHRVVLDVGCGNGYHGWRMLGDGAKAVIGIDPLALNVLQFCLIKQLHGSAPFYVLPLGLEELPPELKLFDSVFSMGVLYHRRSPMDHLLELRDCLQPGGELILETLLIDGGLGEVLVPEGRYACMRNVWFIPSAPTLISWLSRCGFKNIRLVDLNQTTIEEQRSTPWMPFHSLPNFLDPHNPNLTCEGLPAPKRGIFIANS